MLLKNVERFDPATFVDSVEKKLNEGKGTLAWLINAYHWAGREGHLVEVHRYYPGFTMEWLRSRIMAIFNINPSDLERAISRLGGDTAAEAEKVCKMVERVGIAAVCRADYMLTPEQKKTFIAELPEPAKVTPEIFQKEVQKRYDEGLKKMGPAEVKKELRGIEIDYQREYFRLSKENRSLRKETMVLRRENEKLRSENEKIKASVKSILNGKPSRVRAKAS